MESVLSEISSFLPNTSNLRRVSKEWRGTIERDEQDIIEGLFRMNPQYKTLGGIALYALNTNNIEMLRKILQTKRGRHLNWNLLSNILYMGSDPKAIDLVYPLLTGNAMDSLNRRIHRDTSIGFLNSPRNLTSQLNLAMKQGREGDTIDILELLRKLPSLSSTFDIDLSLLLRQRDPVLVATTLLPVTNMGFDRARLIANLALEIRSGKSTTLRLSKLDKLVIASDMGDLEYFKKIESSGQHLDMKEYVFALNNAYGSILEHLLLPGEIMRNILTDRSTMSTLSFHVLNQIINKTGPYLNMRKMALAKALEGEYILLLDGNIDKNNIIGILSHMIPIDIEKIKEQKIISFFDSNGIDIEIFSKGLFDKKSPENIWKGMLATAAVYRNIPLVRSLYYTYGYKVTPEMKAKILILSGNNVRIKDILHI